MFYGPRVFDPLLIIAQIVVLQCLWYISLGCLLWLLLGPYVAHLTLHHFFDWRWFSFRTFTGWMVIIAHTFNALAAAAYLMLVVERAKKCLDFAATLYLIHSVICFSCSGFSRSFAWWLTVATGLAITAVLSEWLCLQREMRDIVVGSGGRRRGGSSGSTTEMVSLNRGSMPSPGVTPKAVTVTSSAFQALKLPGSITGTRSSSNPSGSTLPV